MNAIVLDSCVVTALISPTDALHTSAVEATDRWEQAGASFRLPCVAWSEVLTGALRQGPHVVEALTSFRDAVIDHVDPVDDAVATAAAHLRSRDTALKMPDALILATALELQADSLLTGDKKLEKVAPELVQLVGPR